MPRTFVKPAGRREASCQKVNRDRPTRSRIAVTRSHLMREAFGLVEITGDHQPRVGRAGAIGEFIAAKSAVKGGGHRCRRGPAAALSSPAAPFCRASLPRPPRRINRAGTSPPSTSPAFDLGVVRPAAAWAAPPAAWRGPCCGLVRALRGALWRMGRRVVAAADVCGRLSGGRGSPPRSRGRGVWWAPPPPKHF